MQSHRSVTHLLFDEGNVPQWNGQPAQSYTGTDDFFFVGQALTAQRSTPVIRHCTNPYTKTQVVIQCV